jgi:hypothetical protein
MLMAAKPKVILSQGSVFELDGEIVVRGVLDSDTLVGLQKPKYQREVLAGKKMEGLMEAHRKARVPDIVLNMRGDRFIVRDDGSIELLDPVFMVDGLQRVSSAIMVMKEDGDVTPRIGALVSINRDESWEREQFEILNNHQTKLSPNINLRNQAALVPAINVLWRLTQDDSFVMKGRVQWTQSGNKSDLITATTYVKTVGRLLSHWGSGKGSTVSEVAKGLDLIMGEIGAKAFKGNVKAFFDLLDECWGLSEVEVKNSTLLKNGFLFVVAQLLADYPIFWNGYDLEVPANLKAKLKKIKVTDPSVDLAVSSTSSTSRSLLRTMLLAELQKGMRGGHLQTWAEHDAEGA